MPRSERLPISELRARTGTPPATIHHYVRLGLLPPPDRGFSNRFLYDERHVQRLRLIRLLRRRRRLSLPTIREILPDLVDLGEDQAFRPEMWERLVGRRLAGGRLRDPRRRLLDAAVRAFSERGYDDVNVEELCRSAGLAKGSFYRHYPSKEELFFAAASSAATEVAEGFRQTTGSSLSDARAAELLSQRLAPRLPMFLELLSRALQGRSGYRPAARRVLGGLAEEIACTRRSGESRAAGMRVLERAIGALAADVLSPEAAPRRTARGEG